MAVSIWTTLGLPTGAPTDACNIDLMPAGHTNPANTATGDVPFNVNITEIGNSYTPGQTYSSEFKILQLTSYS